MAFSFQPRRLGFGQRFLKDPFLALVVLSIFLLVGTFVIFPVFKLVQRSLFDHGNFTLDVYTHLYRYFPPLFRSLHVGITTALLGTSIAFVFAYALNRTDIAFKGFFRAIALLPIISPPFLLALAAILLFGNVGFFTKLFHTDSFIWGFNGLVVTETLSYFPIAFIILEGVLRGIDPSLEEASYNLGASRLRVFITVTLPLAVSGLASALLLVFVESLADFGNPMIIGGRYTVLSSEAYFSIQSYNIPRGISLAILLLVPPLIAFFLQQYWIGRRSRVTITGKPSSAQLQTIPAYLKIPLFATVTLFTGIILMFYGTVVFGSLTKAWLVDNSFSLGNYVDAINRGAQHFKDTVLIAAASTPVVGILGMVIAFLVVRKRFVGKGLLEFSSMLTFALPGTVVGIGYILAFNQPPLVLTGTATIIGLVFVFRNMPVGIRAGISSLQQIDNAIEEASTNLGAGTARTFTRVTLPMIFPAMFAGMAYSFVKCMTAISAVIFLVSGDWQLVTVKILAEIDNGNFGTAAALAVMVIGISLAALALMWVFVGRSAMERIVRGG